MVNEKQKQKNGGQAFL